VDDALIKAKVDEIVKWSNMVGECKRELDKLKGEFQKFGIEKMSDKKLKQVEFWGSNNSKVVVTTSESLKVISHTFLAQTLDHVLKDFAKENTTYEYSKPFKQILTAICQGTYVEESLDDAISQVTADEKTRKALWKKLKGNWGKDVQTLINLAGMSQVDAEHYAYFIQEIVYYEKIVHLLEAAGYKQGTPDFDTALKAIRHAVVVEEGVKVGIDAEQEDIG
jgi:hypothetical protein